MEAHPTPPAYLRNAGLTNDHGPKYSSTYVPDRTWRENALKARNVKASELRYYKAWLRDELQQRASLPWDVRIFHKRLYVREVLFRECLRPTADVAAFTRGAESGHRPLPGDFTLKLREGPKQVKCQSAVRSGRVDAFDEGDKLNAPVAESFDLADEVFQEAAEPVKTPNDERIAHPEMFQAFVELRTARRGARYCIRTSSRNVPPLTRPVEGRYLFAGRYTGISDAHGEWLWLKSIYGLKQKPSWPIRQRTLYRLNS